MAHVISCKDRAVSPSSWSLGLSLLTPALPEVLSSAPVGSYSLLPASPLLDGFLLSFGAAGLKSWGVGEDAEVYLPSACPPSLSQVKLSSLSPLVGVNWFLPSW